MIYQMIYPARPMLRREVSQENLGDAVSRTNAVLVTSSPSLLTRSWSRGEDKSDEGDNPRSQTIGGVFFLCFFF